MICFCVNYDIVMLRRWKKMSHDDVVGLRSFGRDLGYGHGWVLSIVIAWYWFVCLSVMI